MKFFFDTMTLLVVSNLSIRAVTTRGLSYLFTNAFTLEASPRLHHSTTLRNTSRQSTRLHSTSEKARILFLGTPEVAATSLQTIVESSRRDENSPYEIVGVVTQPPKRRKRRGKEEQSPVGLIATELDIPILTPEKAKDDAFLTSLENEFKPDLCITAAYGQYLPKRFLKIPKFGTLNIHPSLLPRWRGASPVQRSLEAGDNPVGVTVLFTVSKMDAGPIVAQRKQDIEENENATVLLPKLFQIGTEMLMEVLPDVINGKITMDTAQMQDEDQVVNADMIDSSEGELFVDRDSARVCHNKVRGFSMWPGTFMYVQIGDASPENAPVKLKIIESRVLADKGSESLTSEIVLGPKKGDGLRVVCGDGSVLELLRVQPVTRNAMDAKSFVNGLRGEKLNWVQMP
jgi:methionyl-tRNA formyltransferase